MRRSSFSLAALQAVLLVGMALTACGQQPPSWDSLLSGKITGQYPDYRVSVTAPGQLRIERPGMPAQTVAVEPIAQHCLRGPKDCSYAVEQMLLALREAVCAGWVSSAFAGAGSILSAPCAEGFRL